MTQQLDSSQLLSLLDSSKLLVVCGSGGVGKTTMSAALGALAARNPRHGRGGRGNQDVRDEEAECHEDH